jgi:hypothetical protein
MGGVKEKLISEIPSGSVPWNGDVQDTVHTLKLERRHIESTAAHVPFLDVAVLTSLH